MKRRMTDADRWDDPWFYALTPTAKLVWIYVADRCDCGGVWKVNRRQAEAAIGMPIDWYAIALELGDRVEELQGGDRWYLTKFIAFHYGARLKATSSVHRGVMRALDHAGLLVRMLDAGVVDLTGAKKDWLNGCRTLPEGFAKGQPALLYQDQDQDQDSSLSSSSSNARAIDSQDLTTPAPGAPPVAARPVLTIVRDLSPEVTVIDRLRFAGARIKPDEAGTWLLAVRAHTIERVEAVLATLKAAREPAWWSTVEAWLDGNQSTSRPSDDWHYPADVKFDEAGPFKLIDGERVSFTPTRKRADVQRQEIRR